MLILGLFLLQGDAARFRIAYAQPANIDSGSTFDFTDAVQVSAVDSLPWIEGIVASQYGTSSRVMWGAYSNRLYADEDYFVALPSTTDSLDVLGGKLGCRMSWLLRSEPDVEILLDNPVPTGNSDSDEFVFWPEGADPMDEFSWVVQESEGEGLFRVIEIKPAGSDGPIFEAYVGDLGPWNQSDPYWDSGSRPDAEDGIDSHGRRTNRAGIDVSRTLALALGFSGLLEVDWRFKTFDGKYVIQRRVTEWR